MTPNYNDCEPPYRSSNTSPELYFSYDPIDRFQTHRTREDAIEYCLVLIDGYRKEAVSDGWDDDVDLVCWGIIKQRATTCNDQNSGEPFFEDTCDYELQDIEPIGTPDGLRPCPFCGSHAFTKVYEGKFRVECLQCLGTVESVDSLDHAFRSWNQRAEPDGVPEWLKEKIRAEIDIVLHNDYLTGNEISAKVEALEWVLSLMRKQE